MKELCPVNHLASPLFSFFQITRDTGSQHKPSEAVFSNLSMKYALSGNTGFPNGFQAVKKKETFLILQNNQSRFSESAQVICPA
ncbi:MAG: hypothetical protein ABIB93_04750 [Chloroflexota bacterium]